LFNIKLLHFTSESIKGIEGLRGHKEEFEKKTFFKSMTP